jgi:hypothetical protein
MRYTQEQRVDKVLRKSKVWKTYCKFHPDLRSVSDREITDLVEKIAKIFKPRTKPVEE